MEIKFKVSDGQGYVAAIDPTTGEHRKAATLHEGEEISLNVAPDVVTNVDQIGFGDVVESQGGGTAEPTPTDNAKEPADTPGGGEGGGGAPAESDAQKEEPAKTSAASEKPLYLLDEDKVGGFTNSGFEPSGLETPDGKTLYHYAGDTAGQSATGNADGVNVYADADDNEKPVQPATPAEEGGKESTTEEQQGASA